MMAAFNQANRRTATPRRQSCR